MWRQEDALMWAEDEPIPVWNVVLVLTVVLLVCGAALLLVL